MLEHRFLLKLKCVQQRKKKKKKKEEKNAKEENTDAQEIICFQTQPSVKKKKGMLGFVMVKLCLPFLRSGC